MLSDEELPDVLPDAEVLPVLVSLPFVEEFFPEDAVSVEVPVAVSAEVPLEVPVTVSVELPPDDFPVDVSVEEPVDFPVDVSVEETG